MRRMLALFLAASLLDVPGAEITSEASLRSSVGSGGSIIFGSDAELIVSNEIEITTIVEIESGGYSVRIRGGGSNRLFRVIAPGELRLSGLVLADGSSREGGAIYNSNGVLTVINCVFTNNIATGLSGRSGTNGTNGLTMRTEDKLGSDDGRAGDGENGEPGWDARGGAIYSSGVLRVTNTLFTANRALAGHGGSGGRGGDGGQFASGGICCATGRPGNGGTGAPGGSAEGGAIYSTGPGYLDSCIFELGGVRAGDGGRGGSPGNNFDHANPHGSPGPGGRGGDAGGSSIFSSGMLFLRNCVSAREEAISGHGGDGATGHTPHQGNGGPGSNAGHGGDVVGGVIHAIGSSIMIGTTNHGNLVQSGNGGFGGGGGQSSIDSSVIGGQGGDAGVGGNVIGGLIYAMNASIIDSLVLSNRATAGAGGAGGWGGTHPNFLKEESAGHAGLGGKGGDIQGGVIRLAGTSFVTRAAVSGNSVLGGIGGRGTQGLISTPGNAGRGGFVAGGIVFNEGTAVASAVALELNTISGGPGGTGADGFRQRYAGNIGGYGTLGGDAFGGVIRNQGTLTINSSAIAQNRTSGGPGGFGGVGSDSRFGSGGSGGPGGLGGSAAGAGIFNTGDLRITNSTLAFNLAKGGRGGSGGGPGGNGPFSCVARSGGSAGSGGSAWGAGIESGSGAVVLCHASLVGNSAVSGVPGDPAEGAGSCDGTAGQIGASGIVGAASGGAVSSGASASIILQNSLFSDNRPTNIHAFTISEVGQNLNSDQSWLFASGLNGVDPMLGTLGEWSGPTRIVPLLSGSPAVDAVVTSPVVIDQRGVARPNGDASDIGAFENSVTAYGLSGYVRTGADGVAGIPVTAGNITTHTDSTGFYRIGGLVSGNYSVEPALPCQRRRESGEKPPD